MRSRPASESDPSRRVAAGNRAGRCGHVPLGCRWCPGLAGRDDSDSDWISRRPKCGIRVRVRLGAASPHAVQVAAGWGGAVRALRLTDGEDLWSRALEGRVTASPVFSAGLVFLASEAGELLALDLATGEVRWSGRERCGVQATPLAANGSLYVAFMDGTLRAYRPAPHEPAPAPPPHLPPRQSR